MRTILVATNGGTPASILNLVVEWAPGTITVVK